MFGSTNGSPLQNESGGTLTSIEDGEYRFYPNFFTIAESDAFLENLRNEIDWRQESMNMYGKRVNFPRLTSWYGDNDRSYSFSGITLSPHPWTADLIEIRGKIEQVSSIGFNSVLLNLYRDGNDSISWHTDAEQELGRNPVIASVSFGAKRKFQMRHVNSLERIDIELTHGSLLLMQGATQHYWQHQVPKTTMKLGERINLTFRYIL